MNHTIKLADGREFWMSSFTGEVIDDRKWSETEVWSTSSTGYVDPKNGFAHGGGQQVQSQTFDMKEFWLKDANGKEEKIRLVDFSIDYRVGHVLTVIWGAVRPKDSGSYLAAYNHTIKSGKSLPSGNELISLGKRTGVLKKSIGVGHALAMMALILSIIGLPVAIAWAIWDEVRARKSMNLFRDQIKSTIDSEIYPEVNAGADELISFKQRA